MTSVNQDLVQAFSYYPAVSDIQRFKEMARRVGWPGTTEVKLRYYPGRGVNYRYSLKVEW